MSRSQLSPEISLTDRIPPDTPVISLIHRADVAASAQLLLLTTTNPDTRRGVAALAIALGCTLKEVLK